MGVMVLHPGAANFRTTTFAPFRTLAGTGGTTPFPVPYLEVADLEQGFFDFNIREYNNTGDLTIGIDWCADTATAGTVIWGVAIGVFGEGDVVNIGAANLAAEVTSTDTHLGTQARRPHLHTFTMTRAQADTFTQGEHAYVRIRRNGGTMAGLTFYLGGFISWPAT